MKITKVDIMQVKTNSVKQPWRPIVCRIYTDEGVYGDGEAALTYGIGSPAAFGMIKDLSKLIIGMDPLQNEVIWDKLYKATFWGQNGGPIVFGGISAIDIALWDIKGKFFGVPVYKLLGGKFRESLRTYASQLQFGWTNEWQSLYKTEDYVTAVKKAVAEGYDCVKIDFFTFRRNGETYGPNTRTTLLPPSELAIPMERIIAVREAVGPNVDIIMENHSRLDANSAVQLGRLAEKYNMFYYEEPNTPCPLTAKYMSDRLAMPISQGERVYSRWQFAQFFEQMSIQVIQPDLGNTGGLTEGKKICDMAYVYDISVQAHVCASPLSTAAALHLETAIPNFQIHEHHIHNLQSYNIELATKDLQPVKGRFFVPEDPGLGVELSEFCFKSTLMKDTVE